MTNKEIILAYLTKIAPRSATNADIVARTGVKPHQQVFQITQSLLARGEINGRQIGREWEFWAS